jgi:hypothetical protein
MRAKYKKMNSFHIITLVLLVIGCKKDDIVPLDKIEANIGEPFTVSAPAEISFKETGIILYIDNFDPYINFGFTAPVTKAVIRHQDKKINLVHSLLCDQSDCESSTQNETTFTEEATINEFYTLRFQKVTATNILKDYGKGKYKLGVDSAQFLLRKK